MLLAFQRRKLGAFEVWFAKVVIRLSSGCYETTWRHDVTTPFPPVRDVMLPTAMNNHSTMLCLRPEGAAGVATAAIRLP